RSAGTGRAGAGHTAGESVGADDYPRVFAGTGRAGAVPPPQRTAFAQHDAGGIPGLLHGAVYGGRAAVRAGGAAGTLRMADVSAPDDAGGNGRAADAGYHAEQFAVLPGGISAGAFRRPARAAPAAGDAGRSAGGGGRG